MILNLKHFPLVPVGVAPHDGASGVDNDFWRDSDAGVGIRLRNEPVFGE